MPRRNDKLPTETAYWVKKENSDKGFSVYSKPSLDAMIEREEIKENDRVQFRTAKA